MAIGITIVYYIPLWKLNLINEKSKSIRNKTGLLSLKHKLYGMVRRGWMMSVKGLSNLVPVNLGIGHLTDDTSPAFTT